MKLEPKSENSLHNGYYYSGRVLARERTEQLWEHARKPGADPSSFGPAGFVGDNAGDPAPRKSLPDLRPDHTAQQRLDYLDIVLRVRLRAPGHLPDPAWAVMRLPGVLERGHRRSAVEDGDVS